MTLFSLIQQYSRSIDNGRSPHSIMSKAASELGEMSEEVDIRFSKTSYKKPGKDGVIGEAVDTIIAIVDLICRVYPEMSEQDILKVAQEKLDKWRSLDAQHQAQSQKDRRANLKFEFPGGARLEMLYENGYPSYLIRQQGLCMNKSGEWESEPEPSLQDEDFIERCRWDSPNEAIGFWFSNGFDNQARPARPRG